MPHSKPASKRRPALVAQAAALVVLPAVGLWLYRRGQPEQLGEWQGGKIVQGRIVTADTGLGSAKNPAREIRSQSVYGRDTRVLWSEPAEKNVFRRDESSELTFSGGFVYFTREHPSASVEASSGASGIVRAGGIGTFPGLSARESKTVVPEVQRVEYA